MYVFPKKALPVSEGSADMAEGPPSAARVAVDVCEKDGSGLFAPRALGASPGWPGVSRKKPSGVL
ncbi:MAG TPA: hypothetical protein VK902_17275 [Rubrobacter sp.]|nr:hypothetical protein [Rubrobacter sp.]